MALMKKAMKAAMKATKKNVLKRIKAQNSLGKTVNIGGRKYDKEMILAAKRATRGAHNVVVSKDDAKQIFEAARPAGTSGRSSYDKMEKATMAYIRSKYQFTDAADALLRKMVGKAGAAQAQRTKAMKAMKMMKTMQAMKTRMKTGGRPSKKSPTAKKADKEASKQVQVVKAAVLNANPLPQPVRKLMAKTVAGTLGVMKAERHPFQERIAQDIGQALGGVKYYLAEAITTAQGTVDGASAEEARRAVAKASAETKFAELQDAFGWAKAALEADTAALKGASQAVGESRQAQKQGEADTLKAQASKALVEAAQVELAGLSEKPADAKTMKHINHACEETGLDESLLKMIPPVLKKVPEERGTFDHMAIQQLKDEFTSHLAKLAEELKDPDAASAALGAAVEAAVNAQAAAAAKKETSAVAEKAAQDALKIGKADLNVAAKSVSDFAKDAKKAADGLERSKKAAAAFEDGALTAYAALKDRVPPVEPVEPPAEEPAAAMETVAADPYGAA